MRISECFDAFALPRGRARLALAGLGMLDCLPMDHPDSEALVKAANLEDAETIQSLLNRGVPVDARNKTGWTALMAVANKGNFELVRDLVARGADVDARNNNGWTALMWATLHFHMVIVRFMELVLDLV